MKLRNKKTGEIVEATDFNIIADYNSLAELNAEWEDYEEPKELYVVDLDGEILPTDFEDTTIKKSKEIGNYFETREEAESAVRKLKAWKGLKDAGFKFKGWKVFDHDSPRIYFNVYRKNSDDIVPFLDLLFGGEE